jgi:uncharacterized protein YuzE
MARQFGKHAEYDSEADAIYVYLSDLPVTRTNPLDDCSNIDLSQDGGVVGVEFLGVSGGVDLSDVPHKPTVEKLIGELGLGIRIFA